MAQYNQVQYNGHQYNTDVFNQYVTFTETVALTPSLPKAEAVFLTDSRTASISNKGLSDIISVSEWLSVERTPPQSDWTNQP